MNDVRTVLVSLSRLDASITALEAKEKAILAERQKFELDCRKLEQALSQINLQHTQALEKQTQEEARLREEQRKIVERRRQLSALGGTKSAKLLEREVDVAGRAITQLEAKVVSLIEDAEKLDKRRVELQLNQEVKAAEKDPLVLTWDTMMAQALEDKTAKQGLREEAVKTLTPQIKQTYTRIAAKYPGTAVTKAESGSCQSCFRALPAQIYNSVLGGKELVQCPGCNRILVSPELFDAQ